MWLGRKKINVIKKSKEGIRFTSFIYILLFETSIPVGLPFSMWLDRKKINVIKKSEEDIKISKFSFW